MSHLILTVSLTVGWLFDMSHFRELDSLRGIAALIVVISHYSVLYTDYTSYFDIFPLSILLEARSAVGLFFCLSGFVLSISFFKGKVNYSEYLIKRFFRIYIPYVISAFMAMLAYKSFSYNGIDALSDWFNGAWTTPLSLSNILDHILFIVEFDNGIFNPVYWSLVIEMRISILFFFLIYTAIRLNSVTLFIVWFSVSISALFINSYFKIHSDYLVTFCFVMNFVLGILTYKNLNVIKRIYGMLSTWGEIIVFLFAITLFCYPSSILQFLNVETTFTVYLITGFSSCIIIIGALFSKSISKVLKLRIFTFLVIFLIVFIYYILLFYFH